MNDRKELNVEETSAGFLTFFLLQVFSALMKDGLKETDKSSSSNNSPALRS